MAIPPTDKALSREAKLLLILQALFQLATNLSNLFVSIYLWRMEKDFILVGKYHLMLFICSTLTFIVSGRLVAKWGQAIIYRMGLFSHAVFFTIILLLQERTSAYAIPLGMTLGVSLGFYWLAFHVLSYDFTEPNNRSRFFGLHGLVMSCAGVSGPLIAGILLNQLSGLTGYRLIFSISLLLMVITGALSFLLRAARPVTSYQLGSILFSPHWSRSWKRFLTGTFWFGFREGIFMFLISLLVYISTVSEMSLGWVTSLNSTLSIGAFYLVGRMMRPDNRGKYLLIGAATILSATAILTYEISFYTLLIFGLVNALFIPCLAVPFATLGYDVINQDPLAHERRTEYIVVRELFLNLGRVIPVGCFILLFVPDHPLLLKLFLMLPSLALVGVWWYLRKLDAMGRQGLNTQSIGKKGVQS